MKKCVKIFAWISWWLQFYFGHCLSYNLNAIITKILLLIHRAKITNVHCCFNKCAQWFLFLWWCCLAAISDSVCRLPCCRTEIRKKAKYCLDKGRIFSVSLPAWTWGPYTMYIYFSCVIYVSWPLKMDIFPFCVENYWEDLTIFTDW